MPGYTLAEVARAIGGTLAAPAERTIVRVCTDSRAVAPGDLFFALRGERFDGSDFVPDALARGAVAAVVRHDWKSPAPVGPLIRVADPQEALGALAAFHRAQRPDLRVVGITGSVGKTTTKDFCAAALAASLPVHANPGSYNAEIGLPLTLLEVRRDHQAVVLEMAMRGREQIRYLARIARPQVGVITNIGLSHLELLGSQEAIAAAKRELIEELPPDGTAILNADDPFFSFLREPAPRVVRFGLDREADVRGRVIDPGGASGARFVWTAPAYDVDEQTVTLPLPGRHNVQNALAAIATALVLGVPAAAIGPALEAARISAMRMEVVRTAAGYTVLNDAYNASSPSAMLAALAVLMGPGFAGRRIAVLGNMLELGPAAAAAHREVGEAVARRGPALLVTVGDLARGIAESARAAGMPADAVVACADNESALALLRERLRPGDVVLVKGSRGMHMETLVRGLVDGGA